MKNRAGWTLKRKVITHELLFITLGQHISGQPLIKCLNLITSSRVSRTKYEALIIRTHINFKAKTADSEMLQIIFVISAVMTSPPFFFLKRKFLEIKYLLYENFLNEEKKYTSNGQGIV